jgi:uncharacterized protein YhfF
MWDDYVAANPGAARLGHEAWAFCGGESEVADRLAGLTLAGTKTATASAVQDYEDDEPLPRAGDLSVILGCDGEAVCVIQDTRVIVAPFMLVSAYHAWREGEGDRSLAYWRRVHQEAFASDGVAFSPDMSVVCEEFVRVWPADGVRR